MLNVRVVTCLVICCSLTGCCFVMLFVVIVVQSTPWISVRKEESDDARWITISYFDYHITNFTSFYFISIFITFGRMSWWFWSKWTNVDDVSIVYRIDCVLICKRKSRIEKSDNDIGWRWNIFKGGDYQFIEKYWRERRDALRERSHKRVFHKPSPHL